MRKIFLALISGALVMAPAAAQMSLPGVGGLPDVGGMTGVGDVLRPVTGTLDRVNDDLARNARQLLQLRERTLDRFVKRNRDVVEFDAQGAPARRGVLLALDLTAEAREALQQAGLPIADSEQIEGLDMAVARIALPPGVSVAEGEALLARIAPGAKIAPDNLHFQSGTVLQAVAALPPPASSRTATSVPVGIIDGAPGEKTKVSAARGFAEGAPVASNHGSAIVSLLQGAGIDDIRVADIYGTDRAGGNALALARGLGWLVGNGSKVVTISLVGPRNSVVERAIAKAQSKGVLVVAAVGNDGPAAPPAYPASYSNVVAVTAVDGRRRALIEAGKALHLDYAAPGADIWARDKNGRRVKVRGTSYSTPMVAARAAHALERGSRWRTALDGEAQDLGARGADDVFGRGLLCARCSAK